jgi:hypothetical protein
MHIKPLNFPIRGFSIIPFTGDTWLKHPQFNEQLSPSGLQILLSKNSLIINCVFDLRTASSEQRQQYKLKNGSESPVIVG